MNSWLHCGFNEQPRLVLVLCRGRKVFSGIKAPLENNHLRYSRDAARRDCVPTLWHSARRGPAALASQPVIGSNIRHNFLLAVYWESKQYSAFQPKFSRTGLRRNDRKCGCFLYPDKLEMLNKDFLNVVLDNQVDASITAGVEPRPASSWRTFCFEAAARPFL